VVAPVVVEIEVWVVLLEEHDALAQVVYHEDLPEVRMSHFLQRTQLFKRSVCEKAVQPSLALHAPSHSFGVSVG